MSRLRALIFDFDGLILDTENTAFVAWNELFAEHGHTYRVADYLHIIGTHDETGANPGDPRRILDRLTGGTIDWIQATARVAARERAINTTLPALPGVIDTLDQARRLSLRLAVASSSTHPWVDGHLARLGLADRFETVVCRDDGLRPKPEPDIYLEALRRLGLNGREALALEDSYNGSLAAKRAGLWCIAVPNALTRVQDFSHVDRRLDSLQSLALEPLIRSLTSPTPA